MNEAPQSSFQEKENLNAKARDSFSNPELLEKFTEQKFLAQSAKQFEDETNEINNRLEKIKEEIGYLRFLKNPQLQKETKKELIKERLKLTENLTKISKEILKTYLETIRTKFPEIKKNSDEKIWRKRCLNLLINVKESIKNALEISTQKTKELCQNSTNTTKKAYEVTAKTAQEYYEKISKIISSEFKEFTEKITPEQSKLQIA